MLAHAGIVKPPALTVRVIEAANARAERLGKPPVFVRVRVRRVSGGYVYLWARIEQLLRPAVGGGEVTDSGTVGVSTSKNADGSVGGAVVAPPPSPTVTPTTVTVGVEHGTPVR